ncbi:MAG: pectinesterase family protein, partial [Fibrobacteria bacterium]
DGEYNIGGLTGDANQKTTFTTSNVSFVGQSEDKTILFNKSANEGISITATLYFDKANDIYFQDLSIMNRANYGDVASYNETGRHVAVQEDGNKFVYKNVRLLSTQDTYYTKGTRTYWENGQIHGTTDFICGDGDVFFNGVLLYEMKKSAMTAPSTTSTWGYVFQKCIIDGTVSDFNLGRSWNTAKAVFLNTSMKKLPSAGAWGDPMNSNPQLFAEYKSVTAAGSMIDLSQRRKSYTSGITVTLNPVLSDAEAAKYTVANVLGGNDNWQPQTLTQQVPAPVLTQNGTKVEWKDEANALAWAVFKNGKYLANVATNSFSSAGLAVGDMVTVRAANAMGGLGTASAALKFGTTTKVMAPDLNPRYLSTGRYQKLNIAGFENSPIELTLRNGSGRFIHHTRLAASTGPQELDLSPLGLTGGMYVVVVKSAGKPTKVIHFQIGE